MSVLNKGIWTQEDTLDHSDIIPTQTDVEAGRYHLYIAYSCPFAHRANLVLHYLELQEAISFSSVDAKVATDGWSFSPSYPDPLYQSAFLRELYLKHQADISSRVSVPVLWDKKQEKIASNNSADLAFELATRWLPLAKNPYVLVPDHLKEDILTLNQWIDLNINKKVYGVGLSNTQSTYDKLSDKLVENLTQMDERLAQQRYLWGEQITLSDFFLFPSLIRFEAVYETLFKCNQKPLSAFSHLSRYMLDLYADKRVQATVDIEFAKTHYFYSFPKINPTRVVPKGPILAWQA